MNSLKHFVTEIAPKTWCLSEFNLVNTFLVEGEERAALIDTGCVNSLVNTYERTTAIIILFFKKDFAI